MEFKSPVYNVIAVPIEKIRANEYNPNSVAPPEMQLLYDSIKEDGYTMPIVCYYHKEDDMYEIVDGFHRYSVMLKHKDIYERCCQYPSSTSRLASAWRRPSDIIALAAVTTLI